MKDNRTHHAHEHHHHPSPSEPKHAHPSGEHASHTGHNKHAGHTPEMFRDRFFVSLLLTLPILYFSEQLQDWFGYRAAQFPGSAWVNPVLGTILYFYGGLVFLKGALRELRARTPGMMTLIALGITAAYGYSLAVSLGLPGRPFYWELATLIDVMLLGHWLEMASVQAASRALEELSKLMPTTAHRIVGDRIEDVPVSALKEGDLILIRPGEQVPADGVVVEGASTMNEAFLTGESRPVPKEPGDEVIAGAVNGEGALKVRVTRTGEATTLSQILRLVQEAQASRSRFQALADRVAGWLFYIALTLGTLTFLVWLALGQDFNFALSLAVTVVVIACPHALGLAIPLVMVNATALAARHGILVRNREAFERAREIRFVAFDKTGTLTEGRFAVRAIYAEEFSEEEVLSLAAALEAFSEHPLAQAIVEAAEGRGLPRPEVRDFQAVPGKGVEGTLEGKRYRVGRPEWAEELGLRVSEALKRGLREAEGRGESVVALMDEERVLAYFALADRIRPSAKEAVQRLKAMGLTPVMITGDAEAVAKTVAQELGIQRYHARVLPQDKARIVRELKTQGPTAFVGDGINDAPALLEADLGIAIGAGTNVAIESADLVLVESDPLDVVRALLLARATYAKMVQNLFWATGYNAIALPLAAGVAYPFGIVLSPAVGALFMSLSTVIVALNAMLLRRVRLD
ncbi:heavy metal translocating P-type ATPase [Thermus scotoductus]|uniref:Copper-translocating P-type ATPase n=1 Tax=Thermus scotoductus TaxID=37636 RepID=A0A430QZB1_THESC|nr:heavy metal translocating P-type ATPase [Thermus scotoductus]RTG96696.1 copper-translocating P-type ATPase [Thermus scotoductus]RTH00479.1 copper-translocating P-type ATPase [Thermus scotoductus]RTH23675.1 copper-translocating P-type ATPase [Thermus scotoductus]RTI03140.1 copper-translocating P-type ATPase [Thermus scotoductus]RTI25456.1 copper-translocating P-type ATPase [Thermus scotoductus]